MINSTQLSVPTTLISMPNNQLLPVDQRKNVAMILDGKQIRVAMETPTSDHNKGLSSVFFIYQQTAQRKCCIRELSCVRGM